MFMTVSVVRIAWKARTMSSLPAPDGPRVGQARRHTASLHGRAAGRSYRFGSSARREGTRAAKDLRSRSLVLAVQRDREPVAGARHLGAGAGHRERAVAHGH